MRLFTALWVPPAAVAALLADGAGEPAPPGWRAVVPESWHLLLAFHGEADPGVRARRLDAAVHGAAAPRLRLAGAGEWAEASAGTVRWAGVEEDGAVLGALVTAAGGDPRRFRAHVVVQRTQRRSGPPTPTAPPAWVEHRGPWWRPAEVVLAASEPARGGARYPAVHRVPLSGAGTG
jgi:2'-5' RNA ligase